MICCARGRDSVRSKKKVRGPADAVSGEIDDPQITWSSWDSEDIEDEVVDFTQMCPKDFKKVLLFFSKNKLEAVDGEEGTRCVKKSLMRGTCKILINKSCTETWRTECKSMTRHLVIDDATTQMKINRFKCVADEKERLILKPTFVLL